MSAQLIAVDLGGTNTRVALFEGNTPDPQQLNKVPTEAQEGPEAVINRIINAIETTLPVEGADLKIGVGAPGPLDPRKGIVFEAPNLPGWENIPLQQRLASHFGCPVGIGNDANLAALGEWCHGAGQGADNVIYLTISTGIGGGIITDGHLLLGAHGLGAELGHIVVQPGGPLCGCGRRGHLEAVASGTAIARRAAERLAEGDESTLQSLGGQVTAVDVGQAAQDGDALALEVIQEAAGFIGVALADFAHTFNPEVFVLGGGVSQLGDLLFDPIRRSLKASIMHRIYLEGLRITPAALGDDSGLVGAMVLAAGL